MRFSLPLFVLSLICLLCFSLTNAHAFSRASLPMGDYIRASSLIVIGDINPSEPPDREPVVTVHEVLRGEARPGDHITIPLEGVARYIVPHKAQNVAVLFAPPGAPDPVHEVYQRPGELAALRALIPIYDLPTERAQLLALQALPLEANPLLGGQLISEFARMRQQQNFDIVLASFGRLNPDQKGSLLQLLGRISDERALPLLIASLQAPESIVRYHAAHTLTFRFPGAPGVTAAFRALSQNPATQDGAISYLSRHDPGFAATLPKPPPTLWQQAHQQLKDGNTAAARATYFAIIEEKNESDYGTFSAARSLLPLLDDNGKAHLRTLLAARLEHEDDSYLEAESGIALLRQLRDPSNTAALLHLLHDPTEAPYSAWGGASRDATFALADLGPAAKQSATQQVLKKIKTRLVPEVQLRSNEPMLYFCQLAWLADDATWQQVLTDLPPNLSAQMKALQPVRDAATSKTEAAALSALLPDEQNRWQGDSNRWIIARLGELGDPVAAEPLFEELKRSRFSGNSNDMQAALLKIGGPTVEAGALKLLQSEHDDLRRFGMDILRALRGEKIRPLLREILVENKVGDHAYAIFLLGYVGQPEDIPLLLPLADFWKADRTLQSRATTAIAEIRDRHAYDVNGPIANPRTPVEAGGQK